MLARPDRLHRRGRLRAVRGLGRRPGALGRAACGRQRRRPRALSAWAPATRSRLEAGMPLYGNELDRDDQPVRGRPGPRRHARQGRLTSSAATALEAVAARGVEQPPGRPRGRASAASPATATRSTARARPRPAAWSPAAPCRRRWAWPSPWPTSRRAEARAGYHLEVGIRDDARRRGRPRCRSTSAPPSRKEPRPWRSVTTCATRDDHEWLRVEGDAGVVGITAYAADELGDIVFVELPAVGRGARAPGRPSASSSRSRPPATSTPGRRRGRRGQRRARGRPELVNSDPYGDGWMIKLRLADAARAEAR